MNAEQNNVGGNRGVGDVAPNEDGTRGRTDGTARSQSDQGHGMPVLYTDEDIDAGLGAIYNTTRLPNIQARELAQHVRLLIESSRSERLSAAAAVPSSPAQPLVTFGTTTVQGNATAAPGTPFNGISTIASGVGNMFDVTRRLHPSLTARHLKR